MTLRIGYAAGGYDLFHVGHLNILRRAKEHCDVLIAGVVSDEMLRQVKGVDPVVPTEERAEIVRNIRCVDGVYVERVPSKLDVWREVGFTHFFKGDDWRGTEKGRRLEALFAPVGVNIVYFPYTAHTSSTRLRRSLELLQMGAQLLTESVDAPDFPEGAAWGQGPLSDAELAERTAELAKLGSGGSPAGRA